MLGSGEQSPHELIAGDLSPSLTGTHECTKAVKLGMMATKEIKAMGKINTTC